MKLFKVLLVGVLCFGLICGLSLIGCGDDDEESCKDTCRKMDDCGIIPFGYDEDECTAICEISATTQKKCLLDCDTGVDCSDYSICIGDCGGITF